MPPVQIKTILFIFLLFIIGALIIFAASRYKRNNSKLFSEIWGLYRTEIFIVSALLIPAYFGGAFFVIVLLIFNFRAHYEIFHLHGHTGSILQIIVAYLISSAFIVSAFFYDIDIIVVTLVMVFFIISVVFLMHKSKPGTETTTLYTSPGIILVMLSLCSVVFIRKMEDGFILLLFIYLISESNDAFALIFGKLFGKRKIFPYISPNKTLEGMVAGICFALGTGIICNLYARIFPVVQALILIIITLIGAIGGDLVFSVYKRLHNAKDFMPVMDQHGGIIDVYDSFIFSSILFFIYIGYVHTGWGA